MKFLATTLACLLSLLLLGCGDGEATRARSAEYAVVVSVDGLAARFLIELLEDDRVPTFKRLQSLAAWTYNARTDTGRTDTLPNHTTMITGYPVLVPEGYPRTTAHGYVENVDPEPEYTLHNRGNSDIDYLPSIFDVAHDHGKRTGLFASKTKFAIYKQSYNDAGAPDTVGEDNGTEKIDLVHVQTHADWTANAATATLATNPPNLMFVHLAQPDLTGHKKGWGSDEYMAQVVRMDELLAKIVDVIQNSKTLAGKTALVVTTDHGGEGTIHYDTTNPNMFVIPFYFMAPGIEGGADLYQVAKGRRVAPDASTNPGYHEAQQPIRNGDSGNLALDWLGLPPVPGSLIKGMLRKPVGE